VRDLALADGELVEYGFGREDVASREVRPTCGHSR